jgi:pilus assembly protein CpaB
MRKKFVPLIAIAFVIAAISTAVFYSLFAIRLSGAPAPRGSQTKVIVAARDLPPGTVLAEADVSAMPWLGEQAPKGAYAAPGKVTGKTVFQTIALGEPVLESRLAAKDGTGLGIPEGMRAVSIHVSDSSGVVGLLKPGYKVDIQVFGWRSRKAASLEEMRTLLRGASVLAINTQPEPSSQGYFGAPVVTLLAQANDAEQLALADSYARLRLTLRNPLEQARESGYIGAPAPTPVGQGSRLRVKAVALTDEGLKMLASLVDPRVQSKGMSLVAAPFSVNLDMLTATLQSGNWSRTDAEAVMPAPVNQTSWFDFPHTKGRVRVGYVPLGGSSGIRIRPEVTGNWGGRIETHSFETKLPSGLGRVMVVSGLEEGGGAAPDSRFRHLVVLAAPEQLVVARAAR